MVTVSALLGVLPPFQGTADVIVDSQSIADIVQEVLGAHQEFAPHYDMIAGYFQGRGEDWPGKQLFDFCKAKLRYKAEESDWQSTRPPAGILAMGSVSNDFLDCKHYAGFIAGVLDAINRKRGAKYDWSYRFASYNYLNPATNHVFVVVQDKAGEIWLDPTPIDARGRNVKRQYNDRMIRPASYKDQKPKAPKMTLVRMHGISISGFTSTNTIKRSNVLPACGKVLQDNAHQVGTVFYDLAIDPYYVSFAQRVFNHLLDNTGVDKIIPGAIQELATNPPVQFFDKGVPLSLPLPWTLGGKGHTLPAGLQVEYADSFMGYPIPANLPVPVVVNGGLQWSPFDIPGHPGQATNQILTANNRVLLKVMMSAMGALVQSYSPWPYGQDDSGLQTLAHYILDLRDKEDFREAVDKRTLAGSMIQAVGNTLTAVEEDVLKFIGAPSRNAFLLLVQNNIFGMADGLYSQRGGDLQSAWEHLGGDYNGLLGSVDTGRNKKAILGIGQAVGCAACEQAVGCVDGVSTSLCAAIATAAPVLAILGAYLKKISPNAAAAVSEASAAMNVLQGASPQQLANLVNKPVTVTGPGGQPQTVYPVTAPASPVWAFVKANPIESVLIAGTAIGLVSLLFTPKRKHG